MFISLEGVEGVGKTTCVEYIASLLKEQHLDVITTREPGGTEIAEGIRQVLLQHYDEQMARDTELLLLFAGRAQHIATKIRPALENGSWVISDRFTDASYAYQGAGRGIECARIADLEQWVQGDLRPDRVILLDAPAEIAIERVKKRGDLDRIESEKIDFFNRIRQCYLQRAQANPEKYRIVDASLALDKVFCEMKKIVEELLI